MTWWTRMQRCTCPECMQCDECEQNPCICDCCEQCGCELTPTDGPVCPDCAEQEIAA